METKKTKRANVYRKRGLYFGIGLLVSISLTITAFEWKFEETSKMNFQPIDTEPEALIDIPITEINHPKPPKPVIPKIVIIDEGEEPDELPSDLFTIEFNDDTPIPEPEFGPIPPDEPSQDYLIIVEENASFNGGFETYGKFLKKNLKYPRMARKMQIEGKVYVQFIVNTDGSLTDIEVIKGIGAGCDKEAIRVIKKSPKWNPGKQRGRAVRQRMIIPIVFRLS